MTGLDPDFLAILRCPVCRGEVEEELEPHRLRCRDCARVYRVTDGIPAMAPDMAEEQ
ncbi:MAG: Trm112 family protein [Acidimicrobiia bacterium]